ncbi:UDP-glucuronosyltransferase 2A3 [Blattella germanica]|nr:UDP-glucuronosyltransferase 2A3 [Blattella germanica]
MAKPAFFIINTILLLASQDVSGARILVILPTVVKSHFTTVEPYLKALAVRGHQLTVFGHFPLKESIPNYMDFVIDDDKKEFGEEKGIDIERVLVNMNPFINVQNLNKFGVSSCESVLSQPKVQELIKSKKNFDVVIHDVFHTDCFLAFAYKFKAITIGISTSVLMPWANARVGNPTNPSYIPNIFSPYSDKMNMYERMVNALSMLLFESMHYLTVDLPTNAIVRKHFGDDTPDVTELAKNTSLVLVNSHFSLNAPRPLVPAVVEVGGMHIKGPEPLPKHIQDYLDGADHGAIYFSLGSMIQAKTFPADKRDAFLQAFAEIPQRVLWKWEDSNMPGKPKNVRIEQWCPQLDILRHPKVAAFISHGGLLGSLEATYSGVPVIGIPFFGDQKTNLANMKQRGMAVQLDYHNITKESVLEALRTVLDDVSYIQNARQTARIFRDRPQSALETAIFWTEYVIRHGGAPHLRSAAVDLPTYQYLLLDVIAVMLGSFLVIIFLAVFMLRKIFKALFGSKQAPAPSSKKKRN